MNTLSPNANTNAVDGRGTPAADLDLPGVHADEPHPPHEGPAPRPAHHVQSLHCLQGM